MTKHRTRARTRGQALLEFTLVMPILLLLLMGIFDFGRVFLSYAMASNALRNSLRIAELYGYNGSTVSYADCARMRRDILKTFFVDAPTITISYRRVNGLSDLQCTGEKMDPALLSTGDLLKIRVQNDVRLITPFIQGIVPSIHYDFSGQRTIVKDIPLTNRASGDVDHDGLDDDWEILYFGDEAVAKGMPREDAYELHTGTEDLDGDGCSNGCEESNGTNPNDNDSDGDGLNDGHPEIYDLGTDPTDPDTDGDGLMDGGTTPGGDLITGGEVNGVTVTVTVNGVTEPKTYFTDPLKPDTDGDGLDDGDELAGIDDGAGHIYYSSPMLVDTDVDLISDYDEIYVYHTNPSEADTDHDGLNDLVEITSGTDPLDEDSDNDWLSDGDEVNIYGTDPLDEDSDGDGLIDGRDEVFGYTVNFFITHYQYDVVYDGSPAGCYVPMPPPVASVETISRVYHSNPAFADSDGDNISDWDELHGNAPGGYFTNPSKIDSDNDGLPDDLENYYDTDPNIADTDGDGLRDGDEPKYSTIPTHPDSNCNGIKDGDEVNAGLIPASPDQDNDGLDDNWEIEHFTDLSQSSGDDPDGDDCNNFCEQVRGLDPNDDDSDNDGLKDGEEIYTYYTEPLLPDTDEDGLDDGQEITLGTLPRVKDSDGDGLMDGGIPGGDQVTGGEVNGITVTVTVNGVTKQVTYYTNPLLKNSDGDGLSDGSEVLGKETAVHHFIYTSDPNDTDTDDDGLFDGNEVNLYETDPSNSDTDDDGLSDYNELQGTVINGTLYTTDPLDDDMDDDRLLDGEEVNGTLVNGKLYKSKPTTATSDGDGWNDYEEIKLYGTDPMSVDTDGDTLQDDLEPSGYYTSQDGLTQYVLDPLDPDTDGDDLDDGKEVNVYFTDPLDTDSDDDTLTDGEEVNNYQTDPAIWDTDEDGVNDGDEAHNGGYPLFKPELSIQAVTTVNRSTGNWSGTCTPVVTLKYPTGVQTVTVWYYTQPSSPETAVYTPDNKKDYDPIASPGNQLTFGPSATDLTKSASVNVYNGANRQNDPNETFLVILANPTNNAIITSGSGTGACRFNP